MLFAGQRAGVCARVRTTTAVDVNGYGDVVLSLDFVELTLTNNQAYFLPRYRARNLLLSASRRLLGPQPGLFSCSRLREEVRLLPGMGFLYPPLEEIARNG